MTTFDAVLIGSIIIPIIISIVELLNKEKKKARNIIIICIIYFLIIAIVCCLAIYMHWPSTILNIENVEDQKDQDVIDVETPQSLDSDTIVENVSETESYNYTNTKDENVHLVVEGVDNQCNREAHGKVKNEQDLGGFIYWDETCTDRTYYSINKESGIPTDDTEPLHHITLDLSNGDFIGMAIDICLRGKSSGLAMVEQYNGELIDFYISEGFYTITAEIWDGDSLHPYSSMDVAIDHCGLYVLQ